MISYPLALTWFKSLPQARQISLILSLAFILLLSILLAWTLLSPNYAVLFTHLDEEDASRIIGQLEQEHIPYRIQQHGKEICIEKSMVEKTRLKLMSDNHSFNNSLGFELFDKSDFGMTDFAQKINFQRALQGELERTIKSLEEVKQARVHLVIPQNKLFEQDNNQPKASVTLHLKKPLSPKQVTSIQQLIAASVAHLELKKVVVVDQNGKMLSLDDEGDEIGHFNSKKSLEHYLSNKAMQLLSSIYQDQTVLVKVDAKLNYDELQHELIKPQNPGLISHEKETKHATSAKKETTNQDSTIEKSYQIGQEKELYKRANGFVEQLSVSVVLPQTTTDDSLKQIEALVKTAVGFDAKRGDSISVMALTSPAPKTSLPKIATTSAQPMNPLFFIMPLIGFACLGLSGFLYLKKPRAPKLSTPKVMQTLPECCQELEQCSPLMLSILLEQGQFSWQEQFLAKSKKQLVPVNHIKPATKLALFQQWQQQWDFDDYLENNHG